MLCLAACKVFNLHYGYNLYSAVINEIFLRILMVILDVLNQQVKG